MTPTETTKELMPSILAVLHDLEKLMYGRHFEPSQIRRTLSVAASDNSVILTLQPVIRELRKKAPHMNFRILPLLDTVFQDLAEGSLDFALYPMSSLHEDLAEHFHGQTLLDIQRVCLLRKDHPLAVKHRNGEKITREDFAQFPKIKVELRQNAKNPVFSLKTAVTQDQRKLVGVPYFLSAPYFIEDSDATLVLPERTAHFFAGVLPDLTVIPIPDDGVTYHSRLIWHDRSHRSPEMQWIRTIFISHFENMRKNQS